MAGMNRLAMEISPGPILRARLAAYLAVTTNSVQFGAAAELTAGVGGFGIHGHFSFDALIIFDPFCFRADFAASVSVKAADFDVASIGLHGQFSGPAPYRINGHASISLLFFDVDVDIPEISWGPASAPALPPARDPVAVLAAELGKAANWTPSDQPAPLLARLHPNAVRANFTPVHPMGQIQFRQSAVPLDIQLQRMDAVTLPAPITVHVTADDEDAYKLGPLPQQFPPSQFFTRDDKAKLSSAGYASCNGGFDVNATGAASGADVQTRDLTAECYVLGKGFRRLNFGSFLAALHPDVPRFLQRAELEAPRIDPKVILRDPGAAVIAGTGDLAEQTAAAATAAGVSEVPTHAGLAVQLLDRLSAVDADAARDLQAVSAWEVAAQ
jgi:hypothetical protein